MFFFSLFFSYQLMWLVLVKYSVKITCLSLCQVRKLNWLNESLNIWIKKGKMWLGLLATVWGCRCILVVIWIARFTINFSLTIFDHKPCCLLSDVSSVSLLSFFLQLQRYLRLILPFLFLTMTNVFSCFDFNCYSDVDLLWLDY